ncbi:MAG: 4Fe-4S binding protein [bacterium]
MPPVICRLPPVSGRRDKGRAAKIDPQKCTGCGVCADGHSDPGGGGKYERFCMPSLRQGL